MLYDEMWKANSPLISCFVWKNDPLRGSILITSSTDKTLTVKFSFYYNYSLRQKKKKKRERYSLYIFFRVAKETGPKAISTIKILSQYTFGSAQQVLKSR